MKKNVILLSCMVLLGTSCSQKSTVTNARTVPVVQGDSPETILEKATHVVPTANQLSAMENEFIGFIHFGPNTFTRMEWGNGKEDPTVFNLTNLDTDQWCEAMKAAGMKMVIFTAKHHDGFCLWQTRYTKHDLSASPFRDGKGDILQDLSASCQKYGLKLGIYLSPADLYQMESADGLYGNESSYTTRTIPRAVQGRPFKNTTTFDFKVDDYNEYFLNQLFELLTEYGPVHEVWFDGAHPKTKGGQTYNYAAWKTLIKKLAPEAVIFGKEDIRWCGNESGDTRDTEFNVVAYAENPDTLIFFADMTDVDLGSREKLNKANYIHYQQTEVNTSIREGWFYRDDTRQNVRSADDVFDIYERSVGGNSTFLLNIPPNREGTFSARDVACLKETGKRIRETYGVNLLDGAKGPKEVLDNDTQTFIELDNQGEVIISTPKPITLNRLVIQEAIAQRSERVEKHRLDAWVDGEWKEIAAATNIGYKRILRFADVTTDKLRLRITEARLIPSISNITAHHYAARPPQLAFARAKDGTVQIMPRLQDFGWKTGKDNAAENLNVGYKIYYTTDGTEPTASATLYTKPFKMDAGELKALAVLGDNTGAINKEQIGFVKQDWALLSASDVKDKAPNAFDSNNATVWKTGKGSNQNIALSLGKEQTLSGFAYTPQKNNPAGLMEKGRIEISKDGKAWKVVDTFEFGNLINDPTKRYHYFDTNIKATYVRIVATKLVAKGTHVAVAELDFF